MAATLPRPPDEAQSPASTSGGAAGPRRDLWIVALTILVIAIILAVVYVSYVRNEVRDLRAEVAALTGERDALQGDVDTISGELDASRGALADVDAAVNAAVASCQQTVQSAQAFSGLYAELRAMDELWLETEEDSVEEAALTAAFMELENALLGTIGSFETQADACLAVGQAD